MFAIFPGLLLIPFFCFFVPMGLLFTVFWIWMLIDAAKNPGLDQNERVVWIIVIALLHVLGAFIYLIFGRSKRNLAPTS